MPDLSPDRDNNEYDETITPVVQPSLEEIARISTVQAKQNSDGSSRTTIKPIGMACRACRQRKIRCGGERPRCGYCIKKGYECVLTPHKKRGRPRKDAQKSQNIPSIVASTGKVGSIAIPENVDVHKLWAELTGLQNLELPSDLATLAANAATQSQDTLPMTVPPQFDFLGMAAMQSLTPIPQQLSSTVASGTFDNGLLASNYAFPHFDFGSPPQSAGVTSQPTSVSLPPPPPPPDSLSSHRSTADDPGSLGQNVDSQNSILPISRILDEGIRAYFIYVHPWLPILHRPTFERQIADGTVDKLLYYSVQAISSRFRGNGSEKGQKPYKRGRKYARAARALLSKSLRTAELSTLQAVTILAQYMSSSGKWQEGAAYEKLAVRLAYVGKYHLLDEEFLLPPVANNMGIYESGWAEHSHPARLEVLSRPGGIIAHEQRRRAWWAVFQLERFNGLAMGRPPMIKRGWHWVWLPCSEELWSRDDPAGPLSWEMGLAPDSTTKRGPDAVSHHCRVDLVLALVMGQLAEQRTAMFRLFFPRVDSGTLFYDNLPTHSLPWNDRLVRLQNSVSSVERRIRQWHMELERYADTFSSRRHANFEIIGASCLIHLYAVVLQIREHLFEDLLISVSTGDNNLLSESIYTESNQSSNYADNTQNTGDSCDSRNSSVDFAATFERHMGLPFEFSTYQRGYVAKARRPPLSAEFVRDLDVLAQRCWMRALSMSDEIARLLHVHWLGPLEKRAQTQPQNSNSEYQNQSYAEPLSVFDEQLVPTPKNVEAQQSSADQQQNASENWTPGAADSVLQNGPMDNNTKNEDATNSTLPVCDPLIAERFKLMSPQTPYHLFVAGKVQASRLKQTVTAQARSQCVGSDSRMDVDQNLHSTADGNKDLLDLEEDKVVRDAIRRINDIWECQGVDADIKAIRRRLDDIIVALEYCQLFWFSLDFAAHLRYLRDEASKPLLRNVYRE
ncbi:hypothetical protein COEREDRAFT_82124 [Coemansia reversa NRRL 1564]|uniref:Zn(2)-C6 fungal-type domain-containing protein n=1 Tax=Coemansia reversa (strain ATCC 12441 / NRRL 1564) TaxID=763665 RepID=A0A2G5B8Q1_COERN|nr:hypothetical protein COEREDRAFT_82124 [Coemansia reversa NRRL 1564]|eukprot:PIA15381.1 hypothetical protein COEREDRAFT_82124 [Coemansia reversa NRRL 1564]